MKLTKIISAIKVLLTVFVFASIIAIFCCTSFAENNEIAFSEVVRTIIPVCIVAVVSLGRVFLYDDFHTKKLLQPRAFIGII